MGKAKATLEAVGSIADALGGRFARETVEDATQRLIRSGYPEGTARKIATGELPMDATSRNARALDQGYSERIFYRGTSADEKQLRPGGAEGGATFATSDRGLGAKYAGGTMAGGNPNIMPLRIRGDLYESGYPGYLPDEVTAKMTPAELDAYLDDIDAWNKTHDWDKNVYFEREIATGKRAGAPGTIFRETLDEPAYTLVGGWPSDVVALNNQSSARSIWAAFDPDNTGLNNLLGGIKAAAPLTAAAALGYSEDSEAGFAGTLARTADEFMLGIAKKMKGEGLPREDIWQKTGWFEGVDGKWRFEIDDSGSKVFPFTDPQTERLYPDGFITGDTSDFLLHKELGSAYPDTMRIDTMVEGSKTGKLAGTASYTPAEPGDAYTFGSPEMIRVGPNSGGIDKSAYLHEMQHGIQHREGFAKGGSPYEFLEDLKASKNIYEGEIGALNAQMTDIVRRKDAAIKSGDSALVDSLSKDYEAAMAARSDLVGKMQAQGLDDSIGMMDAANTQYKRLAGEVEARNVQTRLNMSPAERRATPPWTTEDIPESEQIVRMRGAAPLTAAAALGYSEDSEAGPISRGGRILIDSWHGSPHKYAAERLIRKADGSTEYIVGKPDILPDVPEGAEVLQDYPLGRMRMDKIGTGEGAQAYGHGLYSADAKDVAREYRDKLSQISTDAMGGTAIPDSAESAIRQMMAAADKGGDSMTAGALDELLAGDFTPDQIKRRVIEGAAIEGVSPDATLAAIDDAVSAANRNAGALYRTEIDIDPDTLLDWDAYMHDQPAHVQRALVDAGLIDAASVDPESVAKRAKAFGEAKGETGASLLARLENLYREAGALNPKEMASKELKSIGIPGTRYLDGMSRNAGDGSYNYVIFDDSKINIVERGAATPAAMAAAAIPGAVGAYANKRAEQKQTLAQTYAKTNPVNLMAAALLSRVDWSHLDDPARGVYGLVASVKSLFEGQGLSEALQQGGRIASQPVEQTAQQVGDAVFDATGSPAAATAALTATNVWGPM